MASPDEEGRVKLRKATGSRTQAVIRGYPNGATPLPSGRDPDLVGRSTGGTETSKYPQEKRTSQ